MAEHTQGTQHAWRSSSPPTALFVSIYDGLFPTGNSDDSREPKLEQLILSLQQAIMGQELTGLAEIAEEKQTCAGAFN